MAVSAPMATRPQVVQQRADLFVSIAKCSTCGRHPPPSEPPDTLPTALGDRYDRREYSPHATRLPAVVKHDEQAALGGGSMKFGVSFLRLRQSSYLAVTEAADDLSHGPV